MSVNNMTIEQGAAFLTLVVRQMSGDQLATVNTGNLTSVGQNMLRTAYDPLNTAISQVLSRTIVSNRPYTGQLRGLLKDPDTWGGMIRKINYIDGVLEDGQSLYLTGTTPYVDGNVPTPDQYAIRKVATWQSNFYGSYLVQKVITVWRNQLQTAFDSPAAFAQFIAGQMQNVNNQLEQVGDAKARQALINYIGGKMILEADNDPATHVIHLFTEYAADTGVTLTVANYRSPANYKPFIEWLYARIATLVQYLGERGYKYNFSPTIGGQKRHLHRNTPKSMIRGYFISEAYNQIQSMAISEVFNADRLQMVALEPINYWQSSDDPYNIDATVTVNDTSVDITGASTNDLKTAAAQSTAPILGVLFDDEAVGTSIKEESVLTTPVHITGQYSNTAYNYRYGVYNDFTENGVVLMLD